MILTIDSIHLEEFDHAELVTSFKWGRHEFSKTITNFKLDVLAPLEPQHLEIVKKLNAKNKPSDYILQLEWNRDYLFIEEPLQNQLGNLAALPKENKAIILKCKPEIVVDRILGYLQRTPATDQAVKAIMFNLKSYLRDEVFAEEFIFRDGIQMLLSIINYSSGNTQAYALVALRSTMVYISGMEQLVEEPDLVRQLYDLLGEKKSSFNVRRNTLELLFVFCNYHSQSGFSLVNDAAFSKASETNKLPYEDLVLLLTSGDLDTQINTLTLLNTLMMTAPSKEVAQDLLDCWKNQSIATKLQALSDSPNPNLKAQLQVFQSFSGISFVESEAQYAARVLQLEEALKGFQQQQPLIKILRAEYIKAKQLILEAVEAGYLVNSFAPLDPYDPSSDDSDFSKPLDLGPALEQKPSPALTAGGKSEKSRGFLKSVGQKSSAMASKVEKMTKNLIIEEDQLNKRTSSMLSPYFNDQSKVTKLGTNESAGSPTSAASKRSSVFFGRALSREDPNRSEIERLEKLLEEEKHRNSVLLTELGEIDEERKRASQGYSRQITDLERALDQRAVDHLLKRTYEMVIVGSMKRGILYKKRKRLDWKPRYFVIKENYLYYFEVNSSSEIPKGLSYPLGVIPLRYTQDLSLLSEEEAGRPFAFRLSTDKENQLAASSQADVTDWVNILSTIRELARKTQMSLDIPQPPPSRPPRTTSIRSASTPDTDSPSSPWLPTLSEEQESGTEFSGTRSQVQPMAQANTGSPGSILPPSFPPPAIPAPPASSTDTSDALPPPPPPGPGFGGPPPPPPPGFGGPPPPPPFGAPGAFVSTAPQPTKPVVTPKEKMKPLYWTRIIIPPGKGKMIWEDTQEIPINWDEFEGLFCLKKGKVFDDNKEDAPKKQFTRVLEAKRSQKVAIIKSTLPPTETLKQNVEKMDGLSLDQLSLLLSALPEPEEVKMIEDAAQGNVAPLDLPEQFLYDLSRIPSVKERIQCWIFYLGYEGSSADIVPGVEALLLCISQIQSSKTFRVILSLVLTLGNYMNGGNTTRGQADGFQLDILDKLDGTKEASGKMSLLEYLTQILANSYPQSLLCAAELNAIPEATRIPLDELKTSFQKLKTQYTQNAKSYEAAIKPGAPGPISSRLTPFFEKAKREIEALEVSFAKAEKEFQQLLTYFGVPENKRNEHPPPVFLGQISSFLGKIQAANDKLEREKKRQEQKKNRRPVKRGKLDGVAQNADLGDEADPLANIIANIMSNRTIPRPKEAPRMVPVK